MFDFLKKKLKQAIGKFEEKVEEKAEEPPKLEQVEKKGFYEKIKEKVVSTKLSERDFDKLFEELEIVLLESNFAVDVIDELKQDLKEKLVDKPLKRKEINNIIRNTLKSSLEDLFKIGEFDLIKKIKAGKKPYVICFVGVNGQGKTTSLAKIANLLQKNKLSCVFAAADTFRAASIEQLEEHGKKLKIKVVKQKYGSDPAAVAFDAIAHAKAKGIDVVLIDTAGRMHTEKNLMNEMQKIMNVAKPDLKIFIGESIAGNDCIEQAVRFNETINFDGIILTKADVDKKGGAAISITYMTGKPILYLGIGQKYSDLEEFDYKKLIEDLGF